MAGDDSDDPDKPAGGTTPKLTKAEREARRKGEAEDKQREHERAKHALDHKVAWYGTVWVPVVHALLTGFVGGLATLAAKYMDRDVRNQVYEATHADKERAANAQTTLLKLQEDYLEKLKLLQEDQQKIENFARQLVAKEQEIDRLREEYRVALLAMRRRYAGLEAAERARQAAAKATTEQRARREKWKDYGCRIDWLFYGGCSAGTRATFAPGTPDEKVVAHPKSQGATKAVCRSIDVADEKSALAACEKHGAAVLRAKGVAEEDIQPILDAYSSRDVVRRLDDVLSRPLPGYKPEKESVEAILRRNDEAAEKALQEKFSTPK